jgi:hypothetical protein
MLNYGINTLYRRFGWGRLSVLSKKTALAVLEEAEHLIFNNL